MKPGTYILIGVGLAVAVLLGFLVGQRCPRNGGGETPTPKVDTLVIRDTLKVTEPNSVTTREASTPLVTNLAMTRSAICLFHRYSRNDPSGELLPGVSMP